MNVLLDTNAYSALLRGDGAVADCVSRSSHVFVSLIVAGELIYGFRAGARFRRNMADLNEFLENPYVTLLPVTLVTADRFGRIAADLRAKGRPIPSNDIWIAAHAMETGADLVSFDGHFAAIGGLAWVDPSES